MSAKYEESATQPATQAGGAIDMLTMARKRLGMIYNSPSWRRHWAVLRWKSGKWLNKGDR